MAAAETLVADCTQVTDSPVTTGVMHSLCVAAEDCGTGSGPGDDYVRRLDI